LLHTTAPHQSRVNTTRPRDVKSSCYTRHHHTSPESTPLDPETSGLLATHDITPVQSRHHSTQRRQVFLLHTTPPHQSRVDTTRPRDVRSSCYTRQHHTSPESTPLDPETSGLLATHDTTTPVYSQFTPFHLNASAIASVSLAVYIPGSSPI